MHKLKNYIRLIRPQQWIKNAFVFTGLLFGHAWNDMPLVYQVVAAAIAFSLVSSCIYIVNDIADREHDRHHPKKKNRPLASGSLSVTSASLLAIFLGAPGAMIAYWSSPSVFLIITGYAVMNLAYSFGLKHVVILDVFIIATGFMLRILAGTVGVGIPPSQWLLLCGLMITLFLGFAKRRAEINVLSADKTGHRKVLEEYSPVLLDKMMGITAAGVIISYSLYTMSPDTIRTHGTAHLIYTVPFVIYAIFRYVYLLHQRGGGGDPSSDLVRDPHILITVIAWFTTTVWLIS